MPKLQFTTVIHAPLQRVFDLTRCVSLHKRHFESHGILPVQGKYSGLLDKRDHVTWKGKLGRKVRQLALEVTDMQAPDHFKMEYRKEIFDTFTHDVYLTGIDNGTILMDQVEFSLPEKGFSPFFNKRCAEKWISDLLKERNALCKEYAEGNNWHAILP